MLIAVVGEQDVIYGLARAWETHVADGPGNTQVFRTVGEAKLWLARGQKRNMT